MDRQNRNCSVVDNAVKVAAGVVDDETAAAAVPVVDYHDRNDASESSWI